MLESIYLKGNLTSTLQNSQWYHTKVPVSKTQSGSCWHTYGDRQCEGEPWLWMCFTTWIKPQHLISNNSHLEMGQGLPLNIYSPLVICRALFSFPSKTHPRSGLKAFINNVYHLQAASDKTDTSVSAIADSSPLNLLLCLYFTMTRD